MLLSYKKWQKLNENFGVNLGVKTPEKIASLHSRWDEMGLDMPMMMKKKSKKMFGDGPEAGGGPEDLGGGGDAPPFAKKGKKKKPPFGGGGDEGPDDLGGPAPDDEGGDELDLDADMDGDDMGDGPPDADDDGGDMGDGPPPDLGGDMGDEDDADIDLGDGDDEVGDLDDEGDDDSPGAGGPDGPAADGPAPKKGGTFIDKTKAVADGAKMMHKGASKMIKGMKESASVKKMGADCNNTKGLSKKWSKKMTKEETEFWRSLQSQTGATKFAKDDSGVWSPVQEDAVIAPSDPNAGITDEEEAAPGQPGYAPQGRVGGIGSFSEWANKYKRKTKINESKKHKK